MCQVWSLSWCWRPWEQLHLQDWLYRRLHQQVRSIYVFRQNDLQWKTIFWRDDSLALTDDATSEGSHQATVVVEVVLSLIFVGKLNFCIINVTRLFDCLSSGLLIVASYFGWKHYNIRRNSADTYRLFRDQRSDSVVRGKLCHFVYTGCPIIKLALWYLTIVSTSDSQEHLRGPNRF